MSTKKQAYQLKNGLSRVVRAGLVLNSDETVELTEASYRRHDDVLVPAKKRPKAEPEPKEAS